MNRSGVLISQFRGPTEVWCEATNDECSCADRKSRPEDLSSLVEDRSNSL